MALLELKNVSHIYHSPEGETSALKDVTFTVDEREFVSIVGPSGCGKSTILAILAGLLTPSAGEVSIGGSPLNEAKGTTALMPQRDQLFEWRSIMRNVLLGPEIQKTKTPQRNFISKRIFNIICRNICIFHLSNLLAIFRCTTDLHNIFLVNSKITFF